MQGEKNPYYHSPQDTIAHMDLDYWTEQMKATVAIVAHLAISATATTQAILSLQSNGAGTTASIGPDGDLQPGYATVTLNSGTAPYGTALFSYTQNGIVVSEAGVPASPPTTSARIFVDYRTNVPLGADILNIYTGIAVVNMGSGAAEIRLMLKDLKGNSISSGSLQLASKRHLARFIDQLAPELVLPSDFPTANGFGSLGITSDQPLSILALRMTVNKRGDVLLTSTPIADLSSPLDSTSSYFPQVADGGGYQTTLLFLNTSNAQESGIVKFVDNSGSGLNVKLSGGGPAASQYYYKIPPEGALRLVTDGSASNVSTGSAILVPSEGSTPAGAGLFSHLPSGILVTETGIPAATSITQARICVDTSNGHDTGLALVNTSGGTESITLTAFGMDGQAAAGSGTLTIPANGHIARFVGQLIHGGLPQGFTGVLGISSNSSFAAMTLRSLTNSRGDFLLTTFPIADVNSSAPAPLVFPQIAAGGGYRTELVFLSTGAEVRGTINYLGDGGSPISVGGSNTTSCSTCTQDGGTAAKSMERYGSSTTDTSGYRLQVVERLPRQMESSTRRATHQVSITAARMISTLPF
jgi:hypothetical protein